MSLSPLLSSDQEAHDMGLGSSREPGEPLGVEGFTPACVAVDPCRQTPEELSCHGNEGHDPLALERGKRLVKRLGVHGPERRGDTKRELCGDLSDVLELFDHELCELRLLFGKALSKIARRRHRLGDLSHDDWRDLRSLRHLLLRH